jgi:glucose dehydrogenase
MKKSLNIIIFQLINLAITTAYAEELSKYKTIPPLQTHEMALSRDFFNDKSFKKWHRSNSNSSSLRFSSLNQINRSNVSNLEVAFIYNPTLNQQIFNQIQ